MNKAEYLSGLLVFAVLLLSGCTRELPASPASSEGSCLSAVVHDLQEQWPNNRTINVVAFGHSVPAGYGLTPVVHKRDAYPRLLEDALAERYPYAQLNVITSGVGGGNSTEGLTRIQSDVLDHHPRVVLIDFALNDRPLGVEVARANLVRIVSAVRSVGACPVLMTPTWDEKSSPEVETDPLAEQGAMIRLLGQEQIVPVGDSLAAFLEYSGDRSELMAQSNHPNRAGHELVVAKLLPLFESGPQSGHARPVPL